ncbi:hypothetical protein [Neptunomonas antarctica]|uniref:Uncharacterized protein n=1 Tax=Neptunomonas antarctica TaxID=619304 RepID=A0A1N7M943_9GAMM|nr:hypothetical protein [Neptunomonas antarctica]SIS82604.1 hypothetical protein SAMN05421760_105280 [Neptunomonas antarctica]
MFEEHKGKYDSELPKRDWFGDIMLWGFGGTVIGVVLIAIFDSPLLRQISSVPMFIFSALCLGVVVLFLLKTLIDVWSWV